LSQRSNSVADLPVCGPNFYPFSVVSCWYRFQCQ
jgi:hypothetical protein